ncbi:MAG: hypothetical protein KQJ78_04445 [Deltaproteobacteria bacterium]|nr:hypothetical protein [Deltaproteobacteria bacterium]
MAGNSARDLGRTKAKDASGSKAVPLLGPCSRSLPFRERLPLGAHHPTPFFSMLNTFLIYLILSAKVKHNIEYYVIIFALVGCYGHLFDINDFLVGRCRTVFNILKSGGLLTARAALWYEKQPNLSFLFKYFWLVILGAHHGGGG